MTEAASELLERSAGQRMRVDDGEPQWMGWSSSRPAACPSRQLREFVERYSVEPEVERLIVAFHAGESSSKDLSYAKRTLDLGVALIPVLYRDRATKQKA